MLVMYKWYLSEFLIFFVYVVNFWWIDKKIIDKKIRYSILIEGYLF